MKSWRGKVHEFLFYLAGTAAFASAFVAGCSFSYEGRSPDPDGAFRQSPQSDPPTIIHNGERVDL